MGYSSWNDEAAKAFTDSVRSKPAASVFSAAPKVDMKPNDIALRECRDSAANPETVAVMVGLDVTGSMGRIPAHLVQNTLPTMMKVMMDHGTKSPSVMVLGIGDSLIDSSPLQVGQFENGDAELNKWLTGLFIEGGGGGQMQESYQLAWYVAGRLTSIDCFEKRGEKGFLFTIGDEGVHRMLTRSEIYKVFGVTASEDVASETLLREAERTFHVFHIHVSQASHAAKEVEAGWRSLLGERFLVIDDHKNIAELIATTVAVIRGASLTAVTASLSSGAASAVTTALAPLSKNLPAHVSGGTGIVPL